MKKLAIEEIGEQRLTAADAKAAERFPVYVLLDNIRSLYNVGSIFRTADAARIEKMLICGITGRPPRKEIDKTALGAVETVPWEYYPTAVDALEELKREGVPIIALEHNSESTSHWDFRYQFPCCLVIGNEVTGIQDDVLAYVDHAIEIPMYGAKHSLNASVAFWISVYQIIREYLLKQR